jgi:hypothetical protein
MTPFISNVHDKTIQTADNIYFVLYKLRYETRDTFQHPAFKTTQHNQMAAMRLIKLTLDLLWA